MKAAFIGCLVCITAIEARAEFLLSSAIVEFAGDGPAQQDIELISRGTDSDYIVTEVNEVLHPGSKNVRLYTKYVSIAPIDCINRRTTHVIIFESAAILPRWFQKIYSN